MFRLQASMQGRRTDSAAHRHSEWGVFVHEKLGFLHLPVLYQIKKDRVGIPEGQAAAQGGVRLKWRGCSSFNVHPRV
jgi:hypothetical protein